MSNNQNSVLLEIARELLEEVQGHPSGFDKSLAQAIDSKNLEDIRYWVNKIGAELSQAHYENYDLVVW